VTSVHYGKTFNLGNYENERIHLEDDVQPGESTEQAFARVKAWVEGRHQSTKEQLRLVDQREGILSSIATERYRMRQLIKKHEQAVEAFNKLRDLLAQHGVSISPLSSLEQPITNWDVDPYVVDKADDDQADDDQADDNPF
jgi:hypothetical protein